MRVVITRAIEEAQVFADLLRAEGFEPIFLPTITIHPSSDLNIFTNAFARLDTLDWLILTSVNGVNVFFENLMKYGHRLAPGTRIAAVGKKTAAQIQTYGHKVDFIPEQFLGQQITSGLGDLEGKKILLPTADIADPALPEALRAAGAEVEVLTAYHTKTASAAPDALEIIREGVDVISFTSGSTARNFFHLLQANGMDPYQIPNHPALACIGPKTAEVVQSLGFSVTMIADPFTIEGLVNAIVDYRKETTT